jgi:hypothetical protein
VGEGADAVQVAGDVFHNLVRPLLNRYYVEKGGFAPDEHLVTSLAAAVAGDLLAEASPVVYLTPLRRLYLDVDNVSLGDGLLLRRLRDEEIEGWINAEPMVDDVSMFESRPQRLQCAVEETTVVSKDAYQPGTGNPDATSGLVALLRLLTDADVEAPFTQERVGHLYRLQGFSGYWTGDDERAPWRRSGRVGLDDAGRLQRLWKGLRRQRGAAEQRLRLALRRWSDARDRDRLDDRLIDYWIGLEALVLPDSRQEIIYRAALRIAALIGTSGAERRQLYQQLRASYGLRSDTVHGNVRSSSNRQMDWTTVTAFTGGALRRALLTVLESASPVDMETIELDLLGRHQQDENQGPPTVGPG